MKRLKIAAVAGLIVLILTAIGMHAWWVQSGWPQERRSIAWPGTPRQAEIGAGRKHSFELSPDLVSAGVTCKAIGTTTIDDTTKLFQRIEKAHVHLELSTTKEPLDGNSVFYLLYDENGNNLGGGLLMLDGDLARKESRRVIIDDARALAARRIAIYRKSIESIGN